MPQFGSQMLKNPEVNQAAIQNPEIGQVAARFQRQHAFADRHPWDKKAKLEKLQLKQELAQKLAEQGVVV